MATLYEIDERLRLLEEIGVDSETGEILEDAELKQKYDEIHMDLATKIENTVCFIKNLNSDIEAFKTEEDNLKKRRQTKEKLAESLQKYIDNYIKGIYIDDEGNLDTEKLNKYKFETPKAKISYRKSVSVNVTDSTLIPQSYMTIKTTTTPDKKEIKKAIENGFKINGAELQINYNMQIK